MTKEQAVMNALKAAMEWSAAFPLQGTCSKPDQDAAAHVYNLVSRALAILDAAEQPAQFKVGQWVRIHTNIAKIESVHEYLYVPCVDLQVLGGGKASNVAIMDIEPWVPRVGEKFECTDCLADRFQQTIYTCTAIKDDHLYRDEHGALHELSSLCPVVNQTEKEGSNVSQRSSTAVDATSTSALGVSSVNPTPAISGEASRSSVDVSTEPVEETSARCADCGHAKIMHSEWDEKHGGLK